MHLEDNIFNLFNDLKDYKYEHSLYEYFQIFDNKKRDIYKAKVRDRVVHQIIYDYLFNIFNKVFINDSYSSRINKGQYKAIESFRYFIKLSTYKNKQCFVLKCDVKKYFDNIDHDILLGLIKEKVSDIKILDIIEKIIFSYNSKSGLDKGIPLGNITSQIFANIYLDVLDKYIKNELKCRFYIRYNDDFVIISNNKYFLEKIKDKIILFMKEKLILEIPINKTEIRKIKNGIDFIGFTILSSAILLRNKTKDKIYTRISNKNIISYMGILKHCNSYNLKRKILSVDKLWGI